MANETGCKAAAGSAAAAIGAAASATEIGAALSADAAVATGSVAVPIAAGAAGNAFTVRGLSFSYPTRSGGEAPHAVFDGLDLTLREGAVTTLIGANGSGKSTLFNLLTKNLAPQQGSVFLRGGDVAALRLSDFARLVAIVHQRNTAPADLAVEKLVGYGRFPHRKRGRAASTADDERMVAWALETTGLAPLAKQPVSALSGGQLQRVWVAMALAQGTKVLLLDEPTTYLDIRYQLELLELVRRLNRQMGLTVIMVLHDINQAIQFSDELVALADGRIVAQGAPRDVVTPQLLAQVYGVALEVTQVHGRPYVLTAQAAGADLGFSGFGPEDPGTADPALADFGTAPRRQPTPAPRHAEELCGSASAAAISSDGSGTMKKLTKANRNGASIMEHVTAVSPTASAAPSSPISSAPAASTVSAAATSVTSSPAGGKRRFRAVWAAAGFVAFALAVIGVVLPILPTTPFALVAAFCFARSSERLNTWFKSTKLYKKVLEGYVTKRSMTVKAKLSIIIPVTVLLGIGFALMANVPAGRIVLAIVWLGHLVYFGFVVKTEKASAQ